MFSPLIALYCGFFRKLLLFLLRNQSRFCCSAGLDSSFPSAPLLAGPHNWLTLKCGACRTYSGRGWVGDCAFTLNSPVCQFGRDVTSVSMERRGAGKDLRSYLNILPQSMSMILLELTETNENLFAFRLSYLDIHFPFET